MNKKYNINSMTINDLRELIASGDDSHNNQIRVTDNGEVFLSQDIVDSNGLEDIAFRFETFSKNSKYVGAEAAHDDVFLSRIFSVLKFNWMHNCPNSYIDEWIIYEDWKKADSFWISFFVFFNWFKAKTKDGVNVEEFINNWSGEFAISWILRK